MIIREFSIKDYDALITLWNDAQLPFKPKGRDRRDKIEYELKQGRDIFLVAGINGKLVGSVFGTHDGRKGWVNRLAVSPEFQRQDIAKKLIAEVEDRFSELGIDIMACLVEDWNTKSLQVFEKLGYKKHSDIVYFSKRKDSNV
ncbi:MAG: GNAT family N-acetyltransferase [Thermoplasmatales archaeon]|nr:GNAT family N-acetyltransferase [Thermoplasmatales archaeon]